MQPSKTEILAALRREAALWTGLLTTAVLAGFGDPWFADLSGPLRFGFFFGWLFLVMLWLAFGVVRHADSLAVLLGEPYGTLILTISVISIEVIMIAAVMVTGENDPTLARDTILAVLMIVLNGLLGVSLLVGALRHHEQSYNLQGAGAYLGVIIPLAGLGLIMPRYMTAAPGGQVSTLMAVFLIAMSFGLYAAFLGIQTVRHRTFFEHPAGSGDGSGEGTGGGGSHPDHGDLEVRSIPYHAVFLPLGILPIVLLSKKMAVLMDHGIAKLGAPQALGGFLVAILVLSPEAVAAFRAALANNLQRTINISLGSALATIGLTIPAVLGISLITGKTVELGLENAEITLLVLTVLVTVRSFSAPRTNVLHGIVHLILFLAYVVLIFD